MDSVQLIAEDRSNWRTFDCLPSHVNLWRSESNENKKKNILIKYPTSIFVSIYVKSYIGEKAVLIFLQLFISFCLQRQALILFRFALPPSRPTPHSTPILY